MQYISSHAEQFYFHKNIEYKLKYKNNNSVLIQPQFI